MKLIDLLVQHLGSNGGWPIGAAVCAQDNDGEVCFYENSFILRSGSNLAWLIPAPSENRVVKRRIFMFQAEDMTESIITHEQYEAALAAPKQPEWYGEELPPEDIECEVKSGKDSWTLCKVVHSSSAGVAFIYLEEPSSESSSSYLGVIDCIPRKHADSYFRPIRTEAERKREEFAHACIAIDNKTNPSNSMQLFGSIYDAISAGKIPGILLE